GSRHQLEPDDAGEDQTDAAETQRGCGLVEEVDAEERGADRADAGPYRIGSADRQGLQRQAEKYHAEHDAECRPDRRQPPREAFRVFHADGPSDLHQAGNDEIDPGHGVSSALERRHGRASTRPSILCPIRWMRGSTLAAWAARPRMTTEVLYVARATGCSNT